MMMGILFIFLILVIAGIVIVIFWSSKRIQLNPIEEKSKNDSLAILNERYVKGEITKEEFEIIKKDVI